MDESFYEGREQSLVKHKMLREYLIQFALIVSKKWRSITYVDCFTGPWESQSDCYEDTSFALALQQLRKARDERIKNSKNLELRAIFVEHNPKAFDKLQRFVAKVTDVEILPINERFEDSIPQIIDFIDSSKFKSFPFIFIDPTGWTGFGLDRIRPLLNLKNCDVLMNFMTKDIIRFIEHEQSYESFEKLFGSGEFRDELKGKQGIDRVDDCVFKYRDVVSEAGEFTYPGVSTVLNPKQSRTHFHLIYLSRHWRGLNAFKNAEKSSMKDMEEMRARLGQTEREMRTGQPELFRDEEAPESAYYRSLRTRYLLLAKSQVENLLNQHKRISYDKAWQIWLQHALVWESDLKDWVVKSENIEIEGLKPKARKPQRGQNHFLVESADV